MILNVRKVVLRDGVPVTLPQEHVVAVLASRKSAKDQETWFVTVLVERPS